MVLEIVPNWLKESLFAIIGLYIGVNLFGMWGMIFNKKGSHNIQGFALIRAVLFNFIVGFSLFDFILFLSTQSNCFSIVTIDYQLNWMINLSIWNKYVYGYCPFLLLRNNIFIKETIQILGLFQKVYHGKH